MTCNVFGGMYLAQSISVLRMVFCSYILPMITWSHGIENDCEINDYKVAVRMILFLCTHVFRRYSRINVVLFTEI